MERKQNSTNSTPEVFSSQILLARLIEKIADSARRDPNTNLLAKKYWVGEIEDKLKRGEDLGILYLDLDNFKKLNDTYGHDRADRFVEDFAQALTNNFRSEDYITGRLGNGDEFGIAVDLSPSPTRQKQEHKVQRELGLQERMEAVQKRLDEVWSNFINEQKAQEATKDRSKGVDFDIIGLKLSAGSSASEEEKDAEALIRLAEVRMYEQKRATKFQAA